MKVTNRLGDPFIRMAPPWAWAFVINARNPPGSSSAATLAKEMLGSIQWNAVAETTAS